MHPLRVALSLHFPGREWSDEDVTVLLRHMGVGTGYGLSALFWDGVKAAYGSERIREIFPAMGPHAQARIIARHLPLRLPYLLQLDGDVKPLFQFRITSPFGMRLHPTMGTRRHHNGVDIGVSSGTPILAPFDGVVSLVLTDPDAPSGLAVGITGESILGDKLYTSFSHMSSISVAKGQRVVAFSTLLGAVGSTGRSTGPHIHLRLDVNGKNVDPLKPVPSSLGVLSTLIGDSSGIRFGPSRQHPA